jgi:uncharacterized protein
LRPVQPLWFDFLQNACIIVFVKAPHPGQVKTRLGKSVGDRPAAQLYRCFTEDVLDTVETLDVDSHIFFAPAEAEAFLKDWLGEHRSYIPQQGTHLGERMAAAFRHSFSLGYERVLILGSDSPDLPHTFLTEALEALREKQAAIGPSKDGGYYTLGFTPSTFCPAVFGALPWSTPQVYPQTLEILKQHSCPVHVLPAWTDIDTLDDLRQFYRRHRDKPAFNRSLTYIQDHADVLCLNDGA